MANERKPERLTFDEERAILTATSTRKLVHEALALAERRDIVNAIHDLELASRILTGRFWRSIG